MAKLNEKEIADSVKGQGVEKTADWLIKAMKSKEIKLEEVCLMDIAKHCITFKDGTPLGHQAKHFLESEIKEGTADAVSMATMSNITQQFVFSAVLEAYDPEEFAIQDAMGMVPSKILQVEERFPGVSNLRSAGKVVGEGQPYPTAGLSEEWINSPVQKKRGLIIPVTRECVINQREGLVIERANKVGEAVYTAREEEAADCLINAGGTTKNYGDLEASNPYVWRGDSFAVYQTSATNSPFYDNTVASNELVDVANVNNCVKKLNNIRAPLTGLPFAQPGPYSLICHTDYKYTAERIMAMMQFRTGTASSSNAIMISGAMLPAPFKPVASKYLADALARASLTADYFFFGNMKRSFKFVQSWPVTVAQADERSGLAFSHDILFQYKAFRIESCTPWNPRHVVKSKAAA